MHEPLKILREKYFFEKPSFIGLINTVQNTLRLRAGGLRETGLCIDYS